MIFLRVLWNECNAFFLRSFLFFLYYMNIIISKKKFTKFTFTFYMERRQPSIGVSSLWAS